MCLRVPEYPEHRGYLSIYVILDIEGRQKDFGIAGFGNLEEEEEENLMEMIMGGRSCRIQRLCSSSSSSSSSSWKRSKSLLLASELASSSDVARLTGYERLSQSTGLPNEYGGGCKPIGITRKHTAAWRYLGKVFSFKRTGGRGEVAVQAAANPPEVVVKKKNRSSWLPNPDRRWPVQGW